MRFALLLPVLLCAFPVCAEEIRLADGRVYEGEARPKGKNTRIVGKLRLIDVPTAQVKDPLPALKPPKGPDLKPWQARLGKLLSAAALAKDEALLKLAEAEKRALDAQTFAALGRLFPAGAAAPVPSEAPAIRAELARVRIARRYGRWLTTKALQALDPGVVAKAEAVVGELIEARAAGKTLDALLDRVTKLGLEYSTWEALVRGGAGATWATQAPKEAIPLTLPGGKASAYLLRVSSKVKPGVPAPLIVALHGQGGPLGNMIRCWGRFAEARGFLLISVEYAVTGKEGYRHSYLEHSTVLTAMRHLSRTYAIDTDRVFISGHSMGGHAAWDIAFSHPDRFAGLIPMISSHFAFDHHYRRNVRRVPVYCIQGEKDVWTERCRKHTAAMIKRGADVTYVEYIGRGHEGFYEELEWVGPWMAARHRDPYPKRFELVAGRPTDLRRFWVSLDELKIRLSKLAPTSKIPQRFVATLKAKVERKNTLRIDCKEAKSLRVFLSDRLLDLDEPVRIRVNRKVRFKGHVRRSPIAMLLDFLERGDRRTLYAASVEISGL
jgi:predicted esterase